MARVIATECTDHAATSGRWAGALTAALLGATAIVFTLTAAVFAEPVPAVDAGMATETLVRRYYTALNTALATGDLARLNAIVAADARLTSDLPETAAPAALSERLAALRAAQPNLRIDIERVVASRDEAVAWVTIEGLAVGSPLAAPFVGRELALLDGFRVRDGQIVEVWGGTPGLTAPIPVIQANLSPVRNPVLVGLMRFEVEPDAETPLFSGPGPVTIAVERGSLQALMDGSGEVTRDVPGGGAERERTVPRVPASLRAGDQLALDAAAPFRLRNEDDEAASALLAIVFPLAAMATPPPAFDNAGLEVPTTLEELVRAEDVLPGRWLSSGVTMHRLFGEILTAALPHHVRLDVQRVALVPGLEVADWRPTGQVVLAVERGTVVVTATQAARGEVVQPVVLDDDGDAFAVTPGTDFSIRGSGEDPAGVILLTLRAASAQ